MGNAATQKFLQRRGGRGLLLAILAAMGAVPALSTDMYLPGFGEIAADMQTTIEQVQLTLASSFLGLGVGQLFYGPLADRFGRRLPALFGLTLYVFGSILCILAPSLEILIFARLLQGLGGAAAVVISRAMVRDIYQGKEMARMMSNIQSIIVISPTIGPSLGALVLLGASWRWVFVILVALGAIIWFSVYKLPETLEKELRNDHGIIDALKGYGELLRDRDYVFNTLQVFLNSLMMFAYVTSAAAVYLGEYKLSGSALGIIFGATALCLFFGAQLNKVLLKRYSLEAILNWSVVAQLVIVVALLVVSVVSHNLYAVVLLQFAAIMSCGLISSNGMTLAMRNYGHKAASASAIIGTLQHGSAAIAGSALALISTTPLLKMSAGMVVASAIALVILLIRLGRARASAAA